MEKTLRSRKDYESGEYDVNLSSSIKGTELSNVLYFVSRNEFVITLLLVMNTILRVLMYVMLVSLFIDVDAKAPTRILARVTLNEFDVSVCYSSVIFLIGIVASALISRVLKETRCKFSIRHKQLLKVSETASWMRGSDNKFILSVDWNSFKQIQGTYFISARVAFAEQESRIVASNYKDFSIAYKFDESCEKPVLDFEKGILTYNILPNPVSMCGNTLGNWSKLEESKRLRVETNKE